MENNLYHLDEGGNSDNTSEAAISRKRIIQPGLESQQKSKISYTKPAIINNDSVPEHTMSYLKNPNLKPESQQNADDPSPIEANYEIYEVDELEEPSGSQEGQRMSLKVMTVKATGSPHAIEHECPHCDYKTPKRFLLSRHMKSHSDDRPYICSMCDRSYKRNTALQVHMKVHLEHKPHACLSCESRFNSAGDLARHVQYKHTFEKRHKCSKCDYATIEMSTLRRHMRAHTGERPYQCPHCTYASKDNFKLKRHLRIHTGEKPYECDICQSRFTQSNSLKSHMRAHTGERPYKCPHCPYSSKENFNLKRHLRIHTGEKPHKKAHEDQYIDDEDETNSPENFEGDEVIVKIEEAEDDLTIVTLEPTTSKAHNVKKGIIVQLIQEQVKENKYGIKIENEFDEIDEDDESGLVV